jgi:hypothetical protein
MVKLKVKVKQPNIVGNIFNSCLGVISLLIAYFNYSSGDTSMALFFLVAGLIFSAFAIYGFSTMNKLKEETVEVESFEVVNE